MCLEILWALKRSSDRRDDPTAMAYRVAVNCLAPNATIVVCGGLESRYTLCLYRMVGKRDIVFCSCRARVSSNLERLVHASSVDAHERRCLVHRANLKGLTQKLWQCLILPGDQARQGNRLRFIDARQTVAVVMVKFCCPEDTK